MSESQGEGPTPAGGDNRASEGKKPKKSLKSLLRSSLKPLGIVMGVVLTLALLGSFPFTRSMFNPVILLWSEAPQVEVSEWCPVYTTDEKPTYQFNFQLANKYRTRVFKKEALPEMLKLEAPAVEGLPDIELPYGTLDKFGESGIVTESSGNIHFTDIGQGEVRYTAEPLPQGDYALVVDAVNSFCAKAKPQRDIVFFRVTNLGAIIKRDLEKVLVRTVDLKSRQARANVDVTLLAREDNRPSSAKFLLKGNTDKDGLVVLKKPAGLDIGLWNRLTVVAHQDKDRAYIGDTYNAGNRHFVETFSETGDFADYTSRVKTFFNTDRPMYRLGQTVYFNAYIRSLEPNGLQSPGRNKQISITVRNPNYEDFWTGELKTDRFGNINGSIKIPADAQTGNYTVDLKTDDYNVASYSFAVAQYRKPEFRVTVTPASPHVVAGEKLKLNLKADYYFGGGVPNAQISYTISPTVDLAGRERLWPRPAFCSFFDNWGLEQEYYPYNYSANVGTTGTAVTNADGMVTIEVPTNARLISASSPDTYDFADRSYHIQATVTDSSRKTVTGGGEGLVTQGDINIAAKPDSSIVNAGETAHIKIKAGNYDGKAVAAQSIEVEMIQWILKDSEKNLWDRKVLATKSAQTDAGGVSAVDFPLPAELGTDDYYFVAKTKDAGNHVVGDVTRIYVAGKDSPWLQNMSHEQPLQLQLDKQAYGPSQTAKVLLSTSAIEGESTPVLVSIEGTKLHDYKIVNLKSKSQVFEIPLKKEYAPNVYVTATLLDKKHRPIMQSKMLCVSPDFHFLTVGLTSDKKMYKAADKATFTAKVTDKQGKPVPNTVLALSVADQSVYAAAADPNSPVQAQATPDIFQSFYSSRENWVVTRASFTDYFAPVPPTHVFFDGIGLQYLVSLLSPSAWYQMNDGAEFKGASLAGASTRQAEYASLPAPSLPAAAPMPQQADRPRDAKEESANAATTAASARPRSFSGSPAAEPRVRRGFKDLAGWFPILITDSAGIAHASITMPDDLTAWRATIAGINEQTEVGSAETTVTTTQDFIARLSMPRFFTQGDSGLVTAIIHNYSDKVQPVTLALTMSGCLKSSLPLTVGISVPVNGEKRYSWPVKAMEPGNTKVKLIAKGEAAGDALEVKLPVRPFTYRAFFAQGGILKNDQATKKFPIVIPPDADLSTGQMALSFAASAIGPVLGNFGALIDYPYGCTEQTLSKLVPSTIAMRLHTQLHVPLPDSLQSKFKTVYDIAMPKLTEYQHNDGGWGWWKDDESNAYLTAHVLEGLYFLRSTNFTIPGDMIDRGLNFLSQRADQIITDKWERQNAVDHAKAAYVLSLYERPISLKMEAWHMFNIKNMTPEELSYLTLAFKKLGKDSLAKETYKRLLELKNESHDYIDWDHTEALLKKLEGKVTPWDYTYRYTGVETTALALRAVVAMEPQNEALSEPVSRWLITQHDENGWNNTKCTAQVFEALLERELAISKGRTTSFRATVRNGEKILSMLSFDRQVEAGERQVATKLTSDTKEITVAKDGPGWLYYNSLLTYNRRLVGGQQLIAKSMPDDLRITRRLYRLAPVYRNGSKYTLEPSGNATPAGYKPILLNNNDFLKSGDTLMMSVTVDSPIEVPYVMVDAALPSGGEFVQEVNLIEPDEKQQEVEHDYDRGRWWTHRDVLDDRVVFFASTLPAGKMSFNTFLRMEMPGTFNINPVDLQAMYTKKVRGYSGADSVTIVEPSAKE